MTTILSKSILLFLGAIISATASAQKIADAIYFSHTLHPQAESTNYDDIKWQKQRFDAVINLFDLAPSEKWKVFPNAGFTYTPFEYKTNILNKETVRFDLYNVRAGVNVLNRFNAKWSMLVSGSLAWRTDFSQSFNASKELFPSVAVAAVRTLREGFAIQFGIAFTNEVGRNLLVPYVGYYYRSKDKKIISELFFPNWHFTYIPKSWLEVGASASFDAAFTRIRANVPGNGNEAHFLRTQMVSMGPAVGLKLNKHLWINVRSGFTLLRENELWSADFNSVTEQNLSSQNRLFTRMVLSYRLN